MKRSLMVTALAATAIFFNITASSSGQSVADAYKKAAQAYRDAADKTTADKKPCYREWAAYYDCLASQLVSGSNAKCEAPKCKPGEGD